MSKYDDPSFTRIAKISEIPAGKMKMLNIKNKEVLVANVKGKFYAIANPCTHRDGHLSEGSLEENIVTCPVHGSKFDVTTGESILGPKTGFFKATTGNTTVYELKVDGDNILLYQRSAWGV